MFTLGPIGFLFPALLLALITLPILWLLLRATPPAPIRRRFPGVVLLLGLEDEDNESDKTPWWLLLLRLFAIGAAIIAFAGPILNPQPPREGDGPLLIVIDGTWADARDWPRRMERVGDLLDEAAQSERLVSLVTLTDLPPEPQPMQSATSWRAALPSLEPRPWMPDGDAVLDWANGIENGTEIFWMSDGLDQVWQADLLQRFQGKGPVTIFQSPRPIFALTPPVYNGGEITLSAQRAETISPVEVTVNAHGRDPSGTARVLASATIEFGSNDAQGEVTLVLPSELLARVTRFELAGIRSAGAVALSDDSLARREIAIVAPQEDRETLELLSQTHFLTQALEPSADILTGPLGDILPANPDVVILADVARLATGESAELLDWVAQGGLLLRFAGPRLAASDISRENEDPLMPVRLRAGGRSIGGAMSWGAPKTLRNFTADSPFFGLTIPEDVTVSTQVMAQPDPSLSERTIASLTDGTPLVTRKREGAGQIVLFHVTANADWSSLPLSGLFVEMLERLSIASGMGERGAEELAGTTWIAEQYLDGFGAISQVENAAPVAGEDIATGLVSAALPPGLYASSDQRLALNVVNSETRLRPAQWPLSVTVEGLAVEPERDLKGPVLLAALAALLVDVIAALWVGGRLRGPRGGIAAVLALALLAIPNGPLEAQSDDISEALAATNEVTLAHVLTGNARLDETAQAGLKGLGETLLRRTSVEPAIPVGIDLEMDELAFYPLLYWPITPDQPTPSSEAYDKLNRYLRSGGLILFDTRDGDVTGAGGQSENGRKLRELAAALDIPPLEPVPADHVLTRTFYLLQDFPGRHSSRQVWVEAAPPDAEQIEGMPFRNLNDNVTPVVIGGNDWAAAWATDANGNRMFPVGRGFAGERQREIAYRFGVNLVMHVLTGNYKSDQVHVPALLDRLGQ